LADTKLTDLTGLATAADGDKLYIVDVSDTTGSSAGTSKVITFANLEAGIDHGNLTGLSTGADHSYIDQSVISGATPTFTNTNFTEATNKNYVTDAEATVIGNTSGANTGDEVAASTTVSGVIEIATATETNTGTSAALAVSPDGLQGSFRNLRFFLVTLIASDTDVATDTTIGGDWTIPFTGVIVQSDADKDYFAAYTDTAGETGTMIVDVHLNGTTIMDTNKLDIETLEKDTTTAATQPDLTTTAVTKGDILTYDVDAIHTTPAKGLKVMVAIRPA